MILCILKTFNRISYRLITNFLPIFEEILNSESEILDLINEDIKEIALQLIDDDRNK